MPVGRPTSYKPEYCANVIEWGKLGKSKAWMCASLGIARVTMDRWIAEIEQFSYAMDEALTHSQLWWEDAGQDGMTKQQFSAAIWSRSMAARFPNDWREKTDNTTTHNLGDGMAELMGLISGKTRSL